MELNVDKIIQIKRTIGLTWQEIAKIGGLKSRQHALSKCNKRSLRSAEFFAKIFHMDPKDLIK